MGETIKPVAERASPAPSRQTAEEVTPERLKPASGIVFGLLISLGIWVCICVGLLILHFR